MRQRRQIGIAHIFQCKPAWINAAIGQHQCAEPLQAQPRISRRHFFLIGACNQSADQWRTSQFNACNLAWLKRQFLKLAERCMARTARWIGLNAHFADTPDGPQMIGVVGQFALIEQREIAKRPFQRILGTGETCLCQIAGSDCSARSISDLKGKRCKPFDMGLHSPCSRRVSKPQRIIERRAINPRDCKRRA